MRYYTYDDDDDGGSGSAAHMGQIVGGVVSTVAVLLIIALLARQQRRNNNRRRIQAAGAGVVATPSVIATPATSVVTIGTADATAAAASQWSTTFAVGTRVQIQGLVNATDLNGLIGHVDGVQSDGSHLVKLLHADPRGQCHALNAKNLTLMPSETKLAGDMIDMADEKAAKQSAAIEMHQMTSEISSSVWPEVEAKVPIAVPVELATAPLPTPPPEAPPAVAQAPWTAAAWLEGIGIRGDPAAAAALESLGVTSEDDIVLLTESDLKKSGVKLVTAKKIVAAASR